MATAWESYLATLGSEHRYNFRRRLKKATGAFELRFDQARSPEECRIALAQLIALHDERWQGHGGSDAFRSAAVVKFHQAMSRLALDNGWLRLFVLRFDGVPVAALYAFLYRGVFSFYQSGYDPRHARHSVGLLAMGLAIKTAIEDGADEYRPASRRRVVQVPLGEGNARTRAGRAVRATDATAAGQAGTRDPADRHSNGEAGVAAHRRRPNLGGAPAWCLAGLVRCVGFLRRESRRRRG